MPVAGELEQRACHGGACHGEATLLLPCIGSCSSNQEAAHPPVSKTTVACCGMVRPGSVHSTSGEKVLAVGV